ncbi:MBOAT family protein [Paenibacillus alba]|nr:MBOAT family protein [Paenibacillus alba]
MGRLRTERGSQAVMMFNTPEFALLLVITMCMYYLIPRHRLWLLTAANLIFYGVVGPGYLLLFGVISLAVYLCGLGIEYTSRWRRILLTLGILLTSSNLIFFKYTDFALRSIEKVLSIHLVAHQSEWLHYALPLGISFYTFELISYLVDVYKGRIPAERSLLRFWMFIMFFAHMIAGPIMRGKEFLPQIRQLDTIRFNPAQLRLGAFFIVLGLAKKMGIADQLAPYCDSFFSQASTLSGAEGWTASVLYAFQIYCDFSGYSDMAVGIGYLFGLELARNFNTPYLSTNATEFWRRWHITLSSWIRDYIYISLGGSRRGEVRQYANLFAAMTISGFWHGSQWTFIAWGMYQGGLLIGHKLYVNLLQKLRIIQIQTYIWYRMLSLFVFFLLTCLGWVIFRTEGIHVAAGLIIRMLNPKALIMPQWVWHFWWIAGGLYALHVLEWYLLNRLDRVSSLWHSWIPSPIRAAVYSFLVLVFLYMLKQGQSSFIYFQF